MQETPGTKKATELMKQAGGEDVASTAEAHADYHA
jgi:hypothetical protein